METPKFCPVCQRKNKIDATRCIYCGASLAFGHTSLRTTLNITPTINGLDATSSCQDYLELISPGDVAIVVEKHKEPIILREVNEMVLGRYFEEQEGPFLDLDPFGAAAFGVSRRHAQLVRVNDKFVFEDLNSTNGSWINGQRLPAGTSCPVSSGDQIWLGQFKLIICFHQESVLPAESTIILQDTSPNAASLTPDILLERLGPFLKALETLQKVAARCLNEGGQETLTIKSITANHDAIFVIHLAHHPQAAQLVKKWIMPWRLSHKNKDDDTNMNQEMVQLTSHIVSDIAPNMNNENKFSLIEVLMPSVTSLATGPMEFSLTAL